MVEEKKCSFCGKVIEPGTGKMFVKKDGTVLNFDTNKCYKNMIVLKRVARTTLWTAKAHEEKAVRVKPRETAPAEAPAAEEAPRE
ncbi:50S ribosomal protein L24e [Methanomassiliicoccaceae archaeon COG_1]|nr:50S ribosomal protein L24e [Methanomassiliicoccaceae archaeon COG_1]